MYVPEYEYIVNMLHIFVKKRIFCKCALEYLNKIEYIVSVLYISLI